MLLMEFAEALKKGREQIKLSQTRLAAELHITPATVNRWECGHFAPNYLYKAALIAYFEKKNVDDEIIETLKQS